jgi:hypothetical protein
VKREALQKNRGGAEIPEDQFTLHDASLGGHMDAAVQKVNQYDSICEIVDEGPGACRPVDWKH